ncbi:hypothetical protein EDB92DRAFT_1812881 [Lactarius akahatsu]|uniref:Uncharacterized protein n=1 Tax=Lactarius akahatsu TaxID=416441 RepID=A0AAD4LRN1_9AGAM|nr:hypothetical protein EDB92DRAFT_1812881 [Lactarius akahatsu]
MTSTPKICSAIGYEETGKLVAEGLVALVNRRVNIVELQNIVLLRCHGRSIVAAVVIACVIGGTGTVLRWCCGSDFCGVVGGGLVNRVQMAMATQACMRRQGGVAGPGLWHSIVGLAVVMWQGL